MARHYTIPTHQLRSKTIPTTEHPILLANAARHVDVALDMSLETDELIEEFLAICQPLFEPQLGSSSAVLDVG